MGQWASDLEIGRAFESMHGLVWHRWNMVRILCMYFVYHIQQVSSDVTILFHSIHHRRALYRHDERSFWLVDSGRRCAMVVYVVARVHLYVHTYCTQPRNNNGMSPRAHLAARRPVKIRRSPDSHRWKSGLLQIRTANASPGVLRFLFQPFIGTLHFEEFGSFLTICPLGMCPFRYLMLRHGT